MPLSRAKLYRFELPSTLLERGFWLYVWKIQEGHNTRPIFYVGMTGDTGSYSAQSPINRVSGHLGSNEYANALRQYAEKKDINLNGDIRFPVPKLRLFGRGVRVHSDDVLPSFFICQRDRPNAFLKGGRRYSDFCSGNPSSCTREVSRRDAPVSTVCKRRDAARIYPYELRGCRSLLGFWR